MSQAAVAPYGTWKSPITTDLIVSANIALGHFLVDGEALYWSEGRPTEKGRVVIMHRTPDGVTREVTPAPYNARTRVHEYGGGAFCVADGWVYFSNFANQRVHIVVPGSGPHPITPEGPWRFADGQIDRWRRQMICVLEDHSQQGHEPVNLLVALDLDGSGRWQVLTGGNDFYASLRLSPDGQRLAWLTWNHPNMPWDGTELWVGELGGDGTLTNQQLVAGGLEESIFQPEWAPDGRLYFTSDRNNWWNFYRWDGKSVEPVLEMEAEFGKPQWVFGMSTYGFTARGDLLCAYTQGGLWHLGLVDVDTGQLARIESPYTHIAELRTAPGGAYLTAGSPQEATSLVYFDLKTRSFTVIRRSSTVDIPKGYISTPQGIEYPTTGGLTAHGFFYPPANQDYVAPEGEKPPLIVFSHGGPTSATVSVMQVALQYWTSRGFAVLDVNYGGSTGYGRAYRERLKGQWGVVDVDDCTNGALFLADQGLVDRERLIIRGGSAGGYTTLCALTFRAVFKAGASHYGVGDLEALARDTHKFESRYLDHMVGPYPEARQVYLERSSVQHIESCTCPVIFFQGLDDRVVPPNQAEEMVAALRKKGVPVAYVPFDGEGHGFRQAENIKRALEAELYFYARVFGFELPEPVEPVEIFNM
jgi:dipeptidyl aminopeptidase/acylaminoacyl peptidase